MDQCSSTEGGERGRVLRGELKDDPLQLVSEAGARPEAKKKLWPNANAGVA
jgi:hypothetical protein